MIGSTWRSLRRQELEHQSGNQEEQQSSRARPNQARRQAILATKAQKIRVTHMEEYTQEYMHVLSAGRTASMRKYPKENYTINYVTPASNKEACEDDWEPKEGRRA